MNGGSVGRVATKVVEVPQGLALESGASLEGLRIAYEDFLRVLDERRVAADALA